MGKRVYILNSETNNSGVAKIITGDKRTVLSINLEKTSPSKKICQIRSGNKYITIGSFYKKRTDFEIPPKKIIDGIIIF